MTEQREQNWELIAKTLLLAFLLGIVGGFGFWQGTKYCGQQPWPGPSPTPWPTPAPDPDFWYIAPTTITRCLPRTFCDGIPRPGWVWQINQKGVLRYAPPVWSDGGQDVLPPKLLDDLRKASEPSTQLPVEEK